MFTDPQTITIAGSAITLPRVTQKAQSAIYKNADETVVLEIETTTTGRNRKRHFAKSTKRKVVVDPLVVDKQDFDTLSFSTVADRPSYGFSLQEFTDLINAHIAWLQTSGVIAKLWGGES